MAIDLRYLAIGIALAIFAPPAVTHANDSPSLIVRRDLPAESRPFWKSKPELQRRIREERAVIVSVKNEEIANKMIRFSITGAGMVRRSKEFCFHVASQFERLKEVSDHFKTVKYDTSNKQLFVVTEALGYQARMVMRVLPVVEDWRSELQWEVVWGHFKGMTGLIGFERAEGDQTEMSMSARYEAEELPLPKSLMGFALEVITQKVAERMRSFIEEQPAQAIELAKSSNTVEPSQTKIDLNSIPGVSSLKVPAGFKIEAFIHDVPGARQMSLSPSGTLFVGTRESGKVYAIEGVAEALKTGKRPKPARVLASGLLEPNGVAFHKGSLYVAEISRISRFDKVEENLDHPPKPVVIRSDYPSARHHGWKYIAVGPDGWLYVPVGAPCNVCKSELPIFASLTRMSLDGKKREIVASGIRNTVGFDWDPKTKNLWFTDNGRDMMGDDVPMDELNHLKKTGEHFGFPFCHQGDVKDPEFGKNADCSPKGPYRQPAMKLGPHVAALGMKFYSATQFPAEYRGRVFIAEHGSWNRSKKTGYRISTVKIDANGEAISYEPFVTGWLKDENFWGRPVDIVLAPDGSLLVSDDESGLIYRISYGLRATAKP